MADIIPKFKMDQIKVLATSACNLNCTHCFRSQDKNEYSLSKKQLIEIVDFAIDNSIKKLSFSGGEFFVHENAYEILDYCLKNDLNISILTNAIDIDISFFKKNKNLKKLSFQVSIDGMSEIHNQRRGNMSFERTMKNVKALYDLNIPITASMVLDIYNYKEIIKVLELPYFANFNFLPVASTNEGNSYMDYIPKKEKEEYENTINILYKKENVFMGKEHRCHMFPLGLGIKYDGNVYPCAVARDYNLFCMGNLNEQSLYEIVNNYFESEEGKKIKQYKSNDINKCNECKMNNVCNRGCRVRAYKYFGNLMEPDPFCCRLYKNEFSEESINCLFWGTRNEKCI